MCSILTSNPYAGVIDFWLRRKCKWFSVNLTAQLKRPLKSVFILLREALLTELQTEKKNRANSGLALIGTSFLAMLPVA